MCNNQTWEDANHAFIATALLKLLDLYPFSFIYEIKTEEFTKARFDHAFDYLRLLKRMRCTLHWVFGHGNQTWEDANHTSIATALLKLLDLYLV